jgi:hypothetical protein
MGSPSSPSPLKTNARGGGDTEAYYHIDRDDNDDGPKNTTLSKHQQGREAVLRMMSKQKKRAMNASRSIASPSKIASTAPPKGEFFAFHEHFRPEAYLSNDANSRRYGRNKKKKEPRTRTTTGGGDGGFPGNFHRNAEDIDDEFPVSPLHNNRRGGGGGGQNRKPPYYFD